MASVFMMKNFADFMRKKFTAESKRTQSLRREFIFLNFSAKTLLLLFSAVKYLDNPRQGVNISLRKSTG